MGCAYVVAAFDLGDQNADGQTGAGAELLPDRCQGRQEVGRLGDVVEAHQADVARHRTTRLTERADEPQSDVVIGREDGGYVFRPPEDKPGLVSRRSRPVTRRQW